MEPFQVSAAVLGLLSSITTLSIRLNEFRQTWSEAVTEIDGLVGELSDLTLILKQLQEERSAQAMPNLGSVLQNCNRTVISAELHLQKAFGRKFRGMYWAFTGKRECLQICRSLEAHKSIINIAMTVLLVIKNDQVHDRIDEVLFEIRQARSGLPNEESGYVLRRFLEDTETYAGSVFEGSTGFGVVSEREDYEPASPAPISVTQRTSRAGGDVNHEEYDGFPLNEARREEARVLVPESSRQILQANLRFGDPHGNEIIPPPHSPPWTDVAQMLGSETSRANAGYISRPVQREVHLSSTQHSSSLVDDWMSRDIQRSRRMTFPQQSLQNVVLSADGHYLVAYFWNPSRRWLKTVGSFVVRVVDLYSWVARDCNMPHDAAISLAVGRRHVNVILAERPTGTTNTGKPYLLQLPLDNIPPSAIAILGQLRIALPDSHIASFSPDGELLLCVNDTDSAAVQVIDVNSSRRMGYMPLIGSKNNTYGFLWINKDNTCILAGGASEVDILDLQQKTRIPARFRWTDSEGRMWLSRNHNTRIILDADLNVAHFLPGAIRSGTDLTDFAIRSGRDLTDFHELPFSGPSATTPLRPAAVLPGSSLALVFKESTAELQLVDIKSKMVLKTWRDTSYRRVNDTLRDGIAISGDGRTAAVYSREAESIWIWTPTRE